jgi:hypothetical protein
LHDLLYEGRDGCRNGGTSDINYFDEREIYQHVRGAQGELGEVDPEKRSFEHPEQHHASTSKDEYSAEEPLEDSQGVQELVQLQ